MTTTETIRNLVVLTPDNDDGITMNEERQSNVEKTGNKDNMEGLVVITSENAVTTEKEGQ